MRPFPIFHGPYEVMMADEDGTIRRSDGTEVSTYVNIDGYKTFGKNVGGSEVKVAVHRAVWEAFNGPVTNGMVVDHINQDKTDNRLANLRLMTKAGNTCNTSRRGIHRRGNKWRAVTKSNGVQTNLGTFDSEEDALQAKAAWRERRIKEEAEIAKRAAGEGVE